MQIILHKPTKEMKRFVKIDGRGNILCAAVNFDKDAHILLDLSRERFEYIAYYVRRKYPNKKKFRVKVSAINIHCYFRFDKDNTCELYKITKKIDRTPIDWTKKHPLEVKILGKKKESGDSRKEKVVGKKKKKRKK